MSGGYGGILFAAVCIMLADGVDYLFFRSVYHTGGAITGLKNSEVALVATRRFLFMLPLRETSLGLNKVVVKEWDGATAEHLARFLATPDLTVEDLENRLRTFLPAEHVVPLDELASMTVWSRFMRQVRFKQKGRRATQVLALRGKENHARFERFYAETIAAL
jgi:hypothetical protein